MGCYADSNFDNIRNFMKKVGFQNTEPTYNEKNETTVQLWTIPIPLLIKNVTKLYY